MSAAPREHELAPAYTPAASPPSSPPDPPSVPGEGGAEITDVRLVGVDAQVVSPAWELELLVTGIVLVGLFQIPPWLQEAWRHWEPHVPLLVGVLGRTVLLTVEAGLYALIICFTVALTLRGYWVALVGVNSVFAHGVRWDKQREYGPIQASILRQRVRPLPHFIGRANDVASLVFASGFVFAAQAAAALVPCVIALALLWALTLVVPIMTALAVFGVAAGAIWLAVMGAAAADMRGVHLADGSWQERTVRTLLRGLGALTPDGVRSLGAVLTSNVNKRVAYGTLAVVFVGAYFVASRGLVGDAGLPGASTYTFFAGDARGGEAVRADLYDSLRGADASVGLPSIQSDVVTDPYVRLFVPYVPLRDDAALRRTCPGLRPPPSDPFVAGAYAADSAVLACAARVHTVALDGRPVAAAFHFFTNPRSERRGFLMLIPAATLAAGEHLLTVQPARMNPTPARPVPSDTAPVRIPFWR